MNTYACVFIVTGVQLNARSVDANRYGFGLRRAWPGDPKLPRLPRRLRAERMVLSIAIAASASEAPHPMVTKCRACHAEWTRAIHRDRHGFALRWHVSRPGSHACHAELT